MSFNHPLSIRPIFKHNGSDELPRQLGNSINPRVCQICGDKASIINYGAFSCQSCKTFFRRNGFRPENVRPCLSDNICQINITTRRCCAACRLAKCFSMGMSSDLIRKEVRSNTKQSSSQSCNGKHAVSKRAIPASELFLSKELFKNQPLKNSEWMLLSKIIQAHDRFSTIPHIRHLIKCLPVLHLDHTNAMEMITSMYTSMQSFISSSPDFNQFTTSEQFTLLECNLLVITIFCFVLMLSDEMINNEGIYTDLWTTIYGSDIVLQVKHIDKRLINDLTIVKLMLIILTFSSNCFIVDLHENMFKNNLFHDTHSLLTSQNVYVDLLWKYMIYRHGYYDTVLRFSRFIGIFLNLIKYSTVAYKENIIYRPLVENIFGKVKQPFMTNLIEQNSITVTYDSKRIS